MKSSCKLRPFVSALLLPAAAAWAATPAPNIVINLADDPRHAVLIGELAARLERERDRKTSAP